MALGSKEIEKILESKLVLDCIKITLIQQTDQNPIVYKGSGSIFQDEEGILQLKMYHAFSDNEDVFQGLDYSFNKTNFVPGKIIEKDNYYVLEAIDMNGKIWKSQHISLSTNTSFPGNGIVINATLRYITNNYEMLQQSDESELRVSFIILGKYKIPYYQYEINNNNHSLTLCTLNINNKKCEISEYENHIRIRVDIPENSTIDVFPDIFLESISIGIGAFLKPLIQIITNHDQKELTIFSKRKVYKISAPIPTDISSNPKNINQFINGYINTFNNKLSTLFEYWYRVLSGSFEEPENYALILTTSIEGILKEYYESYYVINSELKNHIDEAKETIKATFIQERVKSIIFSSLGNVTKCSPKNILYSLRDHKLINEELIETWIKLRNKSAHAQQLKKDNPELQSFLDQAYSCLELFYLLIMIHIKYTGEFIQYSKNNWPILKIDNT